jgi:hypothetical protein
METLFLFEQLATGYSISGFYHLLYTQSMTNLHELYKATLRKN